MCHISGILLNLLKLNILRLLLCTALLLTTLLLEVPFLANAFGFASVSLGEYLVAIMLGVLVIPIVEIVKFFQRKAAK